MTEAEIKEQVVELLSEDLITLRSTHENPPPGKDCGEECGVSLDDQIAAANPVTSPMRSGGKKHKKCMDCWNEYISNLTARIHNLYKENTHLKGTREWGCSYPFTSKDCCDMLTPINGEYFAPVKEWDK